MLDGEVTDAIEARSVALNSNHIDIYSARFVLFALLSNIFSMEHQLLAGAQTMMARLWRDQAH